MDKNHDVPQANNWDRVHALTKGAIGSLPFAGGLASEFFSLVLSPPLQKRMDNWLQNLYDEIQQLKDKNPSFNPEELEKNEQFITTVTEATQIALRTHYQEKLVALKNAVVNSIFQEEVNYQHSLFLNLIDAFTPLHIQVINQFYHNPEIHIVSEEGSDRNYSHLNKVELNINNMLVERNLSTAILNDLLIRGIIDKITGIVPITTKKTGSTQIQGSFGFDLYITEFGKAFYDFISESKKNEGKAGHV